MNKNFSARISAAVAAFLMLSLTGCSAGSAGDTAVTTANDSSATVASTVIGSVESIVGNEVVLKLINADSIETSAADSGTPDGIAPSGEMPDMSNMPSGEMPNMGDMSGKFGGGEMPSGEMPSGGFPSDRSGGGGKTSSKINTADIEYSGETATYLLPVGMAIGSGDFSSVSVGNVLSISFDAAGTITAVSILSR